jgi:hypothetical protein
MNRTALVKGPCKITYASATFYSKDDVVVSIEETTFNIETSAHGKVDERITDAIVKVAFTPCGEWEAMATLFPYAATVPGTSLFGASDVPLTIESLVSDKDKVVVNAAAITKCPDILLGAKQTLFGPMEFTGVPSNNTEWSAANRLVTITTNSTLPTGTNFNTSSMITQGYTAAWGSLITSFETYDGFRISFNVSTSPIETDRLGVLDMTFDSLEVECRAKPIQTAAALITAMQIDGTGARRGRSINASGADLVITGDTGAVIVTLKKAAIKGGALHFHRNTPRPGEFVWVATKDAVTDVLYTLT